MKDEAFFTEDAFVKRLKTVLTEPELAGNQQKLFKDFAYGDFAGILKHLDRKTATLRLPDVRNPATDA